MMTAGGVGFSGGVSSCVVNEKLMLFLHLLYESQYVMIPV